MTDDMQDDAGEDQVLAGELGAFIDAELDVDEVTAKAEPTTPAPEAPVAAAPVASETRLRDEKGRFAPKAAADAATTEHTPAPAAPATPPDGTATEGTAAALVSPADGTAPEAQPTAFEPFVVRYGEQVVPIPGAVVTPDGAVIPVNQLDTVHTLMGRGLKYDHEREQFKRAKAELQQAKALHDAETAPVLREIDQAMQLARAVRDASDEASQMQAAERLLAYWLSFAQNEPVLRERMTLEREKAEIALQRQLAQPDPDEARAQLEAQVTGTLASVIAEYQQHPDFKLLTAADWQAVQEHGRGDLVRYFYRVGQQPTAEERALGAHPGEVVFNERRFQADVRDRLTLRQEMAAQAEAHRKALDAATKIAQENAKRTGAPPVKAAAPAPVTRAKARPVPSDTDEDDMDDRLRREFAAILGV